MLRAAILGFALTVNVASVFEIPSHQTLGMPSGWNITCSTNEFRLTSDETFEQIIPFSSVRHLCEISPGEVLHILKSEMAWLEIKPWTSDFGKTGYSLTAHFRLRGGRGVDGSSAPPTLPTSQHPDANPEPNYEVEPQDIRCDHPVRITFKQGLFTVHGLNGETFEISKSNIGNFGTFTDDHLERLLRSHFYQLQVLAQYDGPTVRYQILSKFTPPEIPGTLTQVSLREVRLAGSIPYTGRAAATATREGNILPPSNRQSEGHRLWGTAEYEPPIPQLTPEVWDHLMSELSNGHARFHIQEYGCIKIESRAIGEFYTTTELIQLTQIWRSEGVVDVTFDVATSGPLAGKLMLSAGKAALSRMSHLAATYHIDRTALSCGFPKLARHEFKKTNFEKGDNIGLFRFTQRIDGRTWRDPKSGQIIEKDQAINSGSGPHGPSYWKLKDGNDNRIGTITKEGIWVKL